MGNLLSQSFFIPSPALTENNVPDQSGRVHLITGGYSGCGKELARILYAANADVWIAGRSEERAEAAIQEIRETPNSKGSIQFLYLDLANLMTIRPAVDRFLKDTGVRLHVLTNNAGVMLPPSGSKTAQGLELQMGVNCVGPFLLTRLLTPALRDQAVKEASANRHGIVRVTWASSIGADLGSPKGGVDISLVNEPPKITSQITDYAQSKAGNILLAAEAARRETSRASESNAAVLHCAFNPGNLKSGLQRHLSSAQKIIVVSAM